MAPVAGKASCRFSCMDEGRVKSMPVNVLGILQHGIVLHGLIHRGAEFDGGYRWRVMF